MNHLLSRLTKYIAEKLGVYDYALTAIIFLIFAIIITVAWPIYYALALQKGEDEHILKRLSKLVLIIVIHLYVFAGIFFLSSIILHGGLFC